VQFGRNALGAERTEERDGVPDGHGRVIRRMEEEGRRRIPRDVPFRADQVALGVRRVRPEEAHGQGWVAFRLHGQRPVGQDQPVRPGRLPADQVVVRVVVQIRLGADGRCQVGAGAEADGGKALRIDAVARRVLAEEAHRARGVGHRRGIVVRRHPVIADGTHQAAVGEESRHGLPLVGRQVVVPAARQDEHRAARPRRGALRQVDLQARRPLSWRIVRRAARPQVHDLIGRHGSPLV